MKRNRSSVLIIALILIVLAAGSYLMAGRRDSRAEPSLPEPVSFASESREPPVSHTQPPKEPGRVNLQVGGEYPLLSAVPELHPLVEEFLFAQDLSAFQEVHSPEALWEQGFYMEPLHPGYQDGPYYGWQNVLRVYDFSSAPVIGGVAAGDSREALTALLGPPHFSTGSEEDFFLTGYRFAEFYLLALGEDVVEEFAFVANTGLPGPQANELLNDYNNLGGDLRELTARNDTPYFAGDLTSGFGVWACYSNGLHFTEEGVHIFNNFQGDIYTELGEDRYHFVEEDSVFFLQRAYYRSNKDRYAEAEAISPDGKKGVRRSQTNRPVNGDSFYLLYLDRSGPDTIVYTGHMPYGFYWLGDAYLLYGVYLEGPYIYSLEEKQSYSMDSWKAIGYHLGQDDAGERALYGGDGEAYPIRFYEDAFGLSYEILET